MSYSRSIVSGTTENWTPSQILGPTPQGLVEGTFQQPIDHTGLLPGQTFAQRYWVDSEFATSPNAPIIYHICGEGNCAHGYFLHDNAIFWAQQLGARLVYLEHRYYGRSLPFSDLSASHLKFLTLSNVLDDLATFEKWISKQNGWTGPWIVVGGSYSGTLAALYRFEHPDLVVGALAASAPMKSGVGVDEGTQNDLDMLSSTDPSQGPDGLRQWTYESCTKFGFWTTDGNTLFEPNQWLCGQLYEQAPRFNAQAYNQKYYAPFVSSGSGSASHILFTYGSEDIWTTIGIPVDQKSNPNITVHLIEGAGHHYDLNYPSWSDSSAVQQARALFLQLAKSWITNGDKLDGPRVLRQKVRGI